MKESEAGSFPSLDTRRRVEGGGLIYSMSLLALCGFHGKEDMVDLLLKNGAGNSTVMLFNIGAHCACRIHEFCGHAETKFLTEANQGLNKEIVVFKKLVVFH